MPRERCEIHHLAEPCRACAADALVADTPTLGITPEQAARNAEWAARARAALTHPTKEPA